MKINFEQERERVTMLRELLQMSQTEFSRRIGISQGALSQIESGRSRLSMETLKSLSTEFNINCNWLVNGKGDVFFSVGNTGKTNDKSILIPLVNKKARAGYYKGYSNPDYLVTLDEYKIPGYEGGNYRMFEIEGDSMVPTLYPTEIVIGKRVTDFTNVKNDSLAVILLEKELKAKRITNNPKSKSFKLVCDNPDYEGLTVKYKDVREIWVIDGKISKKFLSEAVYNPDKLKEMEQRLLMLQSRVDKLLS